MKISGIYKIVNKIDGKCYVGSSSNITGNGKSSGRFYHHKRMLRMKRHHCVHLQRAYDLYGEKCFEFIIVEAVPTKDLLVVEQKYLDVAKVSPNDYYNSSFDAGKITMTEEIREKIGKKKKAWLSDPSHHHMFGKRHSKLTIKRIREARKNQAPMSNEMRMEISNRNKGTNNPFSDQAIYKFERIDGEIFEGKRFDFSQKYNLKGWVAYTLVTGQRTVSKQWKLVSSKTI